MKIAYFAHVSGVRDPGVIFKIAGQLAQWRAHGHTAKAFIATSDRDTTWKSALGGALVCQFDGPVSRMRTMARLVHAVRRFNPRITYLRWDVFYPPMLWFPRRAALVVEVNTDDLQEDALGSRLRATYNARTRGFILSRAKALVFVTSELSHRASFSRYPGRHCVVTNGVELAAYPVLPAMPREHPRLVFVGSAGQPWQGIDKLVTLAAMRPEWQIDVVGMDRQMQGSPANVTWHGRLGRTDVIRILAQADVGVGALAIHRKGLDEACALKVREYLAVGLPVVYAGRDADADVLGEHVLSIANTESNVVDELGRITTFVLRSQGDRVPRTAVGHIDTAFKEEQRLALFDDLASA